MWSCGRVWSCVVVCGRVCVGTRHPAASSSFNRRVDADADAARLSGDGRWRRRRTKGKAHLALCTLGSVDSALRGPSTLHSGVDSALFTLHSALCTMHSGVVRRALAVPLGSTSGFQPTRLGQRQARGFRDSIWGQGRSRLGAGSEWGFPVCFLVAMSGGLSVVDIYINAGYPARTGRDPRDKGAGRKISDSSCAPPVVSVHLAARELFRRRVPASLQLKWPSRTGWLSRLAGSRDARGAV